MQEYHFSLQYADFEANLVLGGEWSLHDFAEFLINTIGFDFDHAFQFCNNLQNPYRSSERYSLFADIGEGNGEPGVKDTKISAVFKAAGKSMVFHFDYGDDWFFPITCAAVHESTEKRRFRKVISTKGTPPEQYPDYEE